MSDKRKEKLGMHKKFDSLWLGHYIIEKLVGTDSFYLTSINGDKLPLTVNE
jgi:hypothetical protein